MTDGEGLLRDLEATVEIGTPLPAAPPIRRIAVVRANNIGDFVTATPAFRALRAAFPAAEVVYVGDNRARPLAERLAAWIDRFVEFPGFPGIRERPVEPERIVRFLVRAQAERFDLAVQVHGNGVWSNPFTTLLGARITAGFIRAEDSAEAMGLQRATVFPERRHETLRLLDLLGSIGVPPRGLRPEIDLRPADHREAARLLQAAPLARRGPLVVMHPGGRFRDRIWPAERYARLADTLVEEFDADVLLTGAGADRPCNEAVRDAARHRLSDALDALSLPGLAALIARADVFVGNDSGPAHVAYAMGTPSVTLFGVAPAWEWGSIDPEGHVAVEPAETCPRCGRRRCIHDIPVDEALAAVEGLLAARADRSATA